MRDQTDGRVKFLSRGNGYTLFLTSSEAVLSLSRGGEIRDKSSARESRDRKERTERELTLRRRRETAPTMRATRARDVAPVQGDVRRPGQPY